jgi:hypothetical protein
LGGGRRYSSTTNTISRPRGGIRPRFAILRHALFSQRAQGKPDARWHPRSRVQMKWLKRTRAYRSSGNIRLSLRGSLRLIRDLLGEPCPLATVVRAALSGELDTSPWGVGTTRFRRPLQAPSSARHPRPPHPRPAPVRCATPP